jgi:hypothetical protein
MDVELTKAKTALVGLELAGCARSIMRVPGVGRFGDLVRAYIRKASSLRWRYRGRSCCVTDIDTIERVRVGSGSTIGARS